MGIISFSDSVTLRANLGLTGQFFPRIHAQQRFLYENNIRRVGNLQKTSQ